MVFLAWIVVSHARVSLKHIVIMLKPGETDLLAEGPCGLGDITPLLAPMRRQHGLTSPVGATPHPRHVSDGHGNLG